MAVFKCNEAANDQLIRLFVLGNGRLRLEELCSLHESRHACSLLCKKAIFNKLCWIKIRFFCLICSCILYISIFSFNDGN